jgi:hypothetical protein
MTSFCIAFYESYLSTLGGIISAAATSVTDPDSRPGFSRSVDADPDSKSDKYLFKLKGKVSCVEKMNRLKGSPRAWYFFIEM